MDGAGPSIAFWMLSALTLVAAGGVMVSRNLMHAALFLIVTFMGVAGFFVLLSRCVDVQHTKAANWNE